MPSQHHFVREARDPHCVGMQEACQLLSGAPWRRLVAMGDSVAAGVSEPVGGYRNLDGIRRLAEVLQANRRSVMYRNLAERDLRLAGVRERQLQAALDLQPDLVIVAAGGNDVLGRSLGEDQIANELAAIVAPLVASGAQLVTIGLFDLPRSGLMSRRHAPIMAERFDRLDALTARVSADHGGVHVDNHHHPLAADPGIFASDRIHANARGHAVAAANLIRALAGLLDGGRSAQAPSRLADRVTRKAHDR
jgi:lysophospholipase L1-like esterase